jgi:hypothetical protein
MRKLWVEGKGRTIRVETARNQRLVAFTVRHSIFLLHDFFPPCSFVVAVDDRREGGSFQWLQGGLRDDDRRERCRGEIRRRYFGGGG